MNKFFREALDLQESMGSTSNPYGTRELSESQKMKIYKLADKIDVSEIFKNVVTSKNKFGDEKTCFEQKINIKTDFRNF